MIAAELTGCFSGIFYAGVVVGGTVLSLPRLFMYPERMDAQAVGPQRSLPLSHHGRPSVDIEHIRHIQKLDVDPAMADEATEGGPHQTFEDTLKDFKISCFPCPSTKGSLVFVWYTSLRSTAT